MCPVLDPQVYGDLVCHLDRLRESDTLCIVEGKKDKAALESFGLQRIIMLYHSPLFAIVESIPAECHKVAILTDLDTEGRSLYRRLSKELERRGIQIDDGFRLFLFKETKLRQIESLRTVHQGSL